MAQDTIVANLTSLGLTKNEAKAYHSLVRIGRSSARVIAEDSGIPRSKVYETLSLLEKRGIIKRVSGSDPTLFDPAPVDAALDHLEEAEEDGDLQEHGQAAAEGADLMLLHELHGLLVHFAEGAPDIKRNRS